MQLFDQAFIGDFLLRYVHILVGITWIGMLYYFNLVQVPALAAYGDEGKARMLTLDKVARRALWWFRWAAIATLGTGLLITGVVENYWTRSGDAHKVTISIGMILGTLIDELHRRQLRYGLATLCVGGGMGIATIVERV